MTLSYSSLFNKAWDGLKDQLPLVAGLTLVYFMGAIALGMIPFVGSFLSGPFTAGYMKCLLKIRNKEEIGYQDVFWGFLNLNRLAQLLVAGLLVGALTIAGFIFLILPGIWFAVASGLTTSYIVLTDTDAVTAMKKSLAAVKGQWWNIFGLFIFIGFLMVAGALCFLLGLLVATPISSMMLLLAAETLSPKTQPVQPSLTAGPSVMTINPS